jgi:hypothetical protein
MPPKEGPGPRELKAGNKIVTEIKDVYPAIQKALIDHFPDDDEIQDMEGRTPLEILGSGEPSLETIAKYVRGLLAQSIIKIGSEGGPCGTKDVGLAIGFAEKLSANIRFVEDGFSLEQLRAMGANATCLIEEDVPNDKIEALANFTPEQLEVLIGGLKSQEIGELVRLMSFTDLREIAQMTVEQISIIGPMEFIKLTVDRMTLLREASVVKLSYLKGIDWTLFRTDKMKAVLDLSLEALQQPDICKKLEGMTLLEILANKFEGLGLDWTFGPKASDD